jgi:hypothetical protein
VATPISTTSDPQAARDALLRFGSAYAALVLGLATLALTSGKLANGSPLDGSVLAGVHLITLGWISLSIFAALRVFAGVALGVALDRRRLGNAQWGAWTLGVVLFAFGLGPGGGRLIAAGATLLGIGLALFTALVVPAYARAPRGRLTRAYLVVALVSLWVVYTIGLLAALRRAGIPMPPLGSSYLQAHILVAVFGWAGATVAGVGAHLIPMFALSRNPAEWPVRAALPFFAAVPVFGAISVFAPEPASTLGWGCAAIGSALWILQVVIYARARLRRERDAGLALAGFSTLLLGVAWVGQVAGATDGAFVGLLVLGWLMLFTLGIFHRVVPFLFWFERFSKPKPGQRPPAVRDLTSMRLAAVTCTATTIGVLVWTVGLAGASPTVAIAGATTGLVGSASALLQIPRLVRGGVTAVASAPPEPVRVQP